MADKTLQPTKEVKAYARYIHVSPRKLRLVADMVRKTSVDTALEQLRFSPKKAALPLTKVINSAIANAVHNFNLNRDNLYIKSLTIDGGPVYKRYTPRAQGRAFTERKRTSHINVVLESRVSKHKKSRSIFSLRPKSATPEPADEHKGQIKPQAEGTAATFRNKPRQAPKASERVKQNIVNLKRRLFNRKSGP
jgi:large subunit ribosomal protein L22